MFNLEKKTWEMLSYERKEKKGREEFLMLFGN